jgi:hypothetical protein
MANPCSPTHSDILTIRDPPRPELRASEQVVAVALRDTLPEFLTTAAKTSILVKFIRDRLDLSGTEAISLTA